MKTSNEVDVTSKQCVDVLSEQREHNRGREFYGLIKHLQDKALVDNNQYYCAMMGVLEIFFGLMEDQETILLNLEMLCLMSLI
uniref:Uncharacterized protein n=1 Tax=Lactuca sativa TaxID=4236 RepID=A0A9R1VW67_LACSA|nr:hypothetical protein LSAT_V11C400218960 [Lactuca sativa]